MTPQLPRPRVLRGLLTAVMVGAVATGALPLATGLVPPAGAATCADASGVSVVVDYRELGGGIVTGCAEDGGGRSAAAIFADAGVALSYATRQPGFVCRVNGVPASDPCVTASPANAFWGLWWSDGTRAAWSYSSQGVQGLTVPAGGSVAWAWQQDRPAGSPAAPGVGAPVPPRAPSPSSSPSASPTKSPGSGPASPTKSPSRPPSSSPTSSPSPPVPAPTKSPSPVSPTASPSATRPAVSSESPSDSRSTDSTLAPESPSDSPTTDPAEAPPVDPALGAPAQPDEPTRVPAWLAWGLVALLAVAAGISALVTRRRGGHDAAP